MKAWHWVLILALGYLLGVFWPASAVKDLGAKVGL